jgi:predicted nuclease with TOPRIM domain
MSMTMTNGRKSKRKEKAMTDNPEIAPVESLTPERQAEYKRGLDILLGVKDKLVEVTQERDKLLLECTDLKMEVAAKQTQLDALQQMFLFAEGRAKANDERTREAIEEATRLRTKFDILRDLMDSELKERASLIVDAESAKLVQRLGGNS